jgi:hypothetical protein
MAGAHTGAIAAHVDHAPIVLFDLELLGGCAPETSPGIAPRALTARFTI